MQVLQDPLSPRLRLCLSGTLFSLFSSCFSHLLLKKPSTITLYLFPQFFHVVYVLESFFQCVSYRFMLPMFIKGVTLFAMIIKMVYFRSAYVIIIVFAYWLICQAMTFFQFVIFYARIWVEGRLEDFSRKIRFPTSGLAIWFVDRFRWSKLKCSFSSHGPILGY